jgi:hypothetical protein
MFLIQSELSNHSGKMDEARLIKRVKSVRNDEFDIFQVVESSTVYYYERLDTVTDPPDPERLFQIQPVQKVLDLDIQNWVGGGIFQLFQAWIVCVSEYLRLPSKHCG